MACFIFFPNMGNLNYESIMSLSMILIQSIIIENYFGLKHDMMIGPMDNH